MLTAMVTLRQLCHAKKQLVCHFLLRGFIDKLADFGLYLFAYSHCGHTITAIWVSSLIPVLKGTATLMISMLYQKELYKP